MVLKVARDFISRSFMCVFFYVRLTSAVTISMFLFSFRFVQVRGIEEIDEVAD